MPFAHSPVNFEAFDLDIITEKPGVYGIADAKLKMVYVGQAKNLKQRLKEHYSDEKDCIWKHAPKKFYAEIVEDGEDSRRKREAELIAEYDPPCNKTKS